MLKRQITKAKIKPECVEKYKEYHANVWPELMDAYRKAGTVKLSCFLDGNELLVYSEYDDDDVFAKAKAELKNNEVEIRWQSLMNELKDSSFEPVKYEEVFYMGPIGNL